MTERLYVRLQASRDAIDSGDVKRVSIGFGPKPQASNVNRNPNLTGGESFADDLLLKQGGVSSRVALLLRSAEP